MGHEEKSIERLTIQREYKEALYGIYHMGGNTGTHYVPRTDSANARFL